MYKLLHWLFGWDYIYYKFYFSGYYKFFLGRVRVSKTGQVYTKKHGRIYHIERDAIEEHLWLTCHPDKYYLIAKENT